MFFLAILNLHLTVQTFYLADVNLHLQGKKVKIVRNCTYLFFLFKKINNRGGNKLLQKADFCLMEN